MLLGIDIKHKIIRTDTALEFMNSIMQRARGAGAQSEIQKELVGTIVMTKLVYLEVNLLTSRY